MKNIPLSVLVIGLALVGCASTGVVMMGQNHYTISKTSAACGFRDAGGVKADLFAEMGAYCREQSLYPEVITIEALDGVIGVRCASATIEFRCVRSTTENLAPTGQAPDRDMNRSPTVPSDRGQFGRKPDQPIVIQQKIQSERSDDVYAELKKLKQLLDEKIITQEEFEARKRKILQGE